MPDAPPEDNGNDPEAIPRQLARFDTLIEPEAIAQDAAQPIGLPEGMRASAAISAKKHAEATTRLAIALERIADVLEAREQRESAA